MGEGVVADMSRFALRFENGRFGSDVSADLSNTGIRLGAGFLNIVESDVPYRFELQFSFENRTGADAHVFHKFDMKPLSGQLTFENTMHLRRFVAYHLGFLTAHLLFGSIESRHNCLNCSFAGPCRVASVAYFAMGFADGLLSVLQGFKHSGASEEQLRSLYGDALFFLSGIGVAGMELFADVHTDAWRVRLEKAISDDISRSQQ
jgi:hypothetical protein